MKGVEEIVDYYHILLHFGFSLLIPLGWIVILRPLAGKLKTWSRMFWTMVVLSFISTLGKEFYLDIHADMNDIIANFFGFFLGSALVSYQFHKTQESVVEAEDREVEGESVSLREVLSLMEIVEHRTINFYEKAATNIKDNRMAGLCLLLAKDANKRAERLRFTLSAWPQQGPPPILTSESISPSPPGTCFPWTFCMPKARSNS
jgi:hypothetical protein